MHYLMCCKWCIDQYLFLRRERVLHISLESTQEEWSQNLQRIEPKKLKPKIILNLSMSPPTVGDIRQT